MVKTDDLRDVRVKGQTIKALSDRYSKQRAVLAPRQRFKFKSRPVGSGSASGPKVEEDAAPDNSLSSAHASTADRQVERPEQTIAPPQGQDGKDSEYERGGSIGIYKLADVTKKKLSYSGLSPSSPSQASPAPPSTSSPSENPPDMAEISRISHSVLIYHHPSEDCPSNQKNLSASTSSTTSTTTFPSPAPPTLKTLRVRNATSSLILFAFPVAGPVYVADVHDSVIVLAGCRQLRMHACDGMAVYVECATEPVVEGCVRMGFARCPRVLVRVDISAELVQSGFFSGDPETFCRDEVTIMLTSFLVIWSRFRRTRAMVPPHLTRTPPSLTKSTTFQTRYRSSWRQHRTRETLGRLTRRIGTSYLQRSASQTRRGSTLFRASLVVGAAQTV